jgi:hypothetical protein
MYCLNMWKVQQHFVGANIRVSKLWSLVTYLLFIVTFINCPGPPGAFKRPQRFPSKICFVWRFCMGSQGA